MESKTIIKNISKRTYNFLCAYFVPDEEKIIDTKDADNILNSYPDDFIAIDTKIKIKKEEIIDENENKKERKLGGNKKCHK